MPCNSVKNEPGARLRSVEVANEDEYESTGNQRVDDIMDTIAAIVPYGDEGVTSVEVADSLIVNGLVTQRRVVVTF